MRSATDRASRGEAAGAAPIRPTHPTTQRTRAAAVYARVDRQTAAALRWTSRLVPLRLELVSRGELRALPHDLATELQARRWSRSRHDDLWRESRPGGGMRLPCSYAAAVLAIIVADLRGYLIARGITFYQSAHGLHRRTSRARPADLERLVLAELRRPDPRAELALIVRAAEALTVPASPDARYAFFVLRLRDRWYRLLHGLSAAESAEHMRQREAFFEKHRATVLAGLPPTDGGPR